MEDKVKDKVQVWAVIEVLVKEEAIEWAAKVEEVLDLGLAGTAFV